MHHIELPDKQEIHLVLRRSVEEANQPKPRYVTEESFKRHSDSVLKYLHAITTKMTRIEHFLKVIAQQQTSNESNDAQSTDPVSETEFVEEVHVIPPFTPISHQESAPQPPPPLTKPPMLKKPPSRPQVLSQPVKFELLGQSNVDTQSVAIKRARKTPTSTFTVVPTVLNTKLEESTESDGGGGVTTNDIDIPMDDEEEYQYIEVHDSDSFPSNFLKLPCSSIEELETLNQQLFVDEKFFNLMKTTLTDIRLKAGGNIQRAFSQLIADNVLFNMNWQGLKRKHKMCDMVLFERLIYECWYEDVPFDEYVGNVKVITKKAHKRYAKNQERMRNRSKGMNMLEFTLCKQEKREKFE